MRGPCSARIVHSVHCDGGHTNQTRSHPGPSHGAQWERICLQCRGAGSILGSGRSPGIEVATRFSILVWGIPRTKEPGMLQSTRSQSGTRLSKWAHRGQRLSLRLNRRSVLRIVSEAGDMCKPLWSSVWQSGISNSGAWDQRRSETGLRLLRPESRKSVQGSRVFSHCCSS